MEEKNKTARFELRLTPALKKAAQSEAAKRGVSLSALVYEILEMKVLKTRTA